MMLERHYDEESLIALLHAGDASSSSDPHLAGCTSCADMLESYRVISEVLGAKIVWEPQEMPNEAGAARGVAAIRAFASSMESEDEAAVALVNELLSSPRQWWLATVERDERYHSAGVVRRLIEVSEQKIDTMPPEAVVTAAAAVAVADLLEDCEIVFNSRGSALRQYAYALFYVGDFADSLGTVERAQSTFDHCSLPEYEVARLDIVRSLVYGAQERYTEAIALAKRAADVFRAFGDRQQVASAMMSQAYLMIYARNFRGALPVLVELRDHYSEGVSLHTRALTFQNLGICQQHVEQIPEALNSFQIAAALYDENATVTEAARVRYSVALLLSTQGRHADAKKRLRDVQAEFERLGMVHASVVAGLDFAELALIENNFKEVEELCRAAIRQFEAEGVPHSSEARTALTYLREAAEQRRATQETVWHVRTYLKRLPDEPALLFAPAPTPPA
jgi:tetratricopeptide (TPR) repeat protein